MLDRIDMQIIQVPVQVSFAADRVLPDPALPDFSFSPYLRRSAARFTRANLGKVIPREEAFDLLPTQRVIRILLGKRPNGVDVFREETDCIQVERIFRPHLDEGLPEDGTGLIGGKDGQAMVCDDSEEVATAWNMGSAVVRHVNILNQKIK